MHKYIKTYISFVALALLSMMGILFVHTPSVDSLSGSEFRANRIIDDPVFYAGDTMTVDQIQTFLNSKMPSCDTNGEKMYNSTQTRAQWAQANGKPTPPYTCLKDFKQSHDAKSDSGLCGYLSAGTNRSASQIIDDVARACSVSEKVLIVMLQKEQSLVTDDWPWPVQYEKAMGYYCPDDPNNPGWCHPDYAGFFNQVYNAARQFNRYKLYPQDFNHAAGRTSFVAYQANAPSCGGTNLTMPAAATAGLYNYTPYQPNQAALDNLYGTGDACSAYGNRNFWRMFNDWFGSSILGFKMSSEQFQIWDKAETTRVDPGSLMPGEEYVAKVFAYNTGEATWSNAGPTPVLIGTTFGNNSFLCHPTWISCKRPAVLLNPSVAPGAGGDFKFKIRVPFTPGEYRENFKGVAEMLSWFNEMNDTFGIKVKAHGTFKWENQGYKIKTQDGSTFVDPGNLQKDTTYLAILSAKNVGTGSWFNNSPTPTRLGASSPETRTSVLCTNTWIACNRPATLQEADIAPGQTGHFQFYFKTPSTPGTYREYFKPLSEMYAWMNDTPEHPFGIIVY